MSDRLKFSDSVHDILLELAQGNPGAITALIELLEVGDEFAPVHLFKLDDLAIYGPRIWLLYKDTFRQNAKAFFYALKNNRLAKVIARKRIIDPRFADEWACYATKDKD